MPTSKPPILYIIIVLVLIIISGGLGFLVGSNKSLPASLSPQTISSNPPTSNNGFFFYQDAGVSGKIIRVDGNKISIQSKNNQTQEFEASPNIVITRVNNENIPSTPSSDLKRIEIGQEADISLSVTEGKYKITRITYLPVLPSSTPFTPFVPVTPTQTGSNPPVPFQVPPSP